MLLSSSGGSSSFGESFEGLVSHINQTCLAIIVVSGLGMVGCLVFVLLIHAYGLRELCNPDSGICIIVVIGQCVPLSVILLSFIIIRYTHLNLTSQ